MSLLVLYTVFDAKAAAHLQPFWAVNDSVAIRMFETACMDETHDFNRHAEDYQLYRIGTFDQVDGILEPSAPHPLIGAHQIIAKVNQLAFMTRDPNGAAENSDGNT